MSRHVLLGKLLLCTTLGLFATISTLSAQCCRGNGGDSNYYGRPTTNWNNYTYNYNGTPCNPCDKKKSCGPCDKKKSCGPCDKKKSCGPCDKEKSCDPCDKKKSCGPCEPWGSGCGTQSGFYFGLEGLYWTVCQDNLDYAVEFDSDDDDAILGPGDTKFLDYDWCGGARGHIGYKWCGWDVRGSYTWYKNNSNDRTDRQGDDTLLKASLLHPETNGENAERATIDSEIEYQTFDILFGKDLWFCKGTILLLPFFGVKGIKIEQDLEALYEGEDFVILPAQPFIGGDDAVPARVRWHSNLCAIGLNAGLNMYYKWFCGFGLYGSFNGSVLASRTDVRHKQETLDSDGDVDTTEIDLKEKQCICVPGYQLTTGISWDSCCGDCFYFMFKIGYEFNHWFNTPQLRRYHDGNEGVSSDSSGNIGLHGLTASANFYF